MSSYTVSIYTYLHTQIAICMHTTHTHTYTCTQMQVRCQNRTLGVTCGSDLLVQDPTSSVTITRNVSECLSLIPRPSLVPRRPRPPGEGASGALI